MPFVVAQRNKMLDGVNNIGNMSLHTADPGTTGANEVTGGTPAYARVAATFAAAAAGERALSAALDFNGPANGGVTHFGVWTNEVTPTFIGGGALAGATAFNAEGKYRVTTATKLAVT